MNLEPIPQIAKLSSRVWRILGLNPSMMTLQGSNTYLVGTGTERLLIDSGEGKPEYLDVLKSTMESASKELGKPVMVSKLLFTHWHPDHIGGVQTVQKLFPEVQLLKKPSAYNKVEVDKVATLPPATLNIEGATLQLLPTPGHTDDHICVYLEEEKAIFTSDTILGVGSSTFSCYYDYMATLDLLKSFKPKILYPAHGPVVTDGLQKVEEIIAHRQKRESQILETLESKKGNDFNIHDLVSIIYADTPKKLWGAAGLNVFHHLKKLIHEKKIVVTNCPKITPDILSDATDYSMMGEGVKTDESIMEKVFTDLKVKI